MLYLIQGFDMKKGTHEKQTWDLRSFEIMDRSQEGDDDKIYTI